MGGTRDTHGKKRNSYFVLVEKLERERPLGRLWCRGRDLSWAGLYSCDWGQGHVAKSYKLSDELFKCLKFPQSSTVRHALDSCLVFWLVGRLVNVCIPLHSNYLLAFVVPIVKSDGCKETVTEWVWFCWPLGTVEVNCRKAAWCHNLRFENLSWKMSEYK
jgi:hypothetical protein